MKNKITLHGVWQATWSNDPVEPKDSNWIEALVPGDFTTDLTKEGILPEDIYFRDNLREAKWTEDVYIWYRKEVEITLDQYNKEAELICDGIDMVSDIYINSQLVGKTENAFLQYKIPVSKALRPGKNSITICIKPARSHIATMLEKYPNYWALFTPGRNLVRHAQCQFGWDWAPDALSLGIWKDIYLEFTDGNCIKDLYVETSIAGDCIVRCELNYKKEALEALEKGVPQSEFPLYYPEGSLQVEIWFNGELVTQQHRDVDGVNVFTGIFIDKPHLWWPNGMGEQNLYTAKVSLLNSEGSVEDTISTSFGFRSVEIEESVIETDRVGFCFVVNEQPLYARGANWVPLDCFPGRIDPDKYEKFLKKAKEAHVNMLRIWGGGVYENTLFYELCDRYGIVVWQDFMNACSEIPDDNQFFLDMLVKEAEYQVKRLRNHPSIICWCGGNESSSSHMYEPDKPGRKIVQYYYRGIVTALAKNCLYIPGSSHSKSDFGQVHTSGETHWSMWPRTKETLYGTYKERLTHTRTVFNGEISLQGPSPLKSLKKFLEPKDMWPPSDIYDYHAMYHPAMPEVHPRWVTSQIKATEQIVGPCDSIESFVSNGLMMHSLMVEEELLYYRSMRPYNSGALLWMYNEPWPCTNWALVDYYGNLKGAYWAMKKAFSPFTCYVKERENSLFAYVMGDYGQTNPVQLTISCIDLAKDVVWKEEFTITVDDTKTYCKELSLTHSMENSESRLLFCEIKNADLESTYVYHKPLAKEMAWPSPEFSWEILDKQVIFDDTYQTTIQIRSTSYCRYLYIELGDVSDADVTLSDSYFDMLPETTKNITIVSTRPIEDISVRSLLADSTM